MRMPTQAPHPPEENVGPIVGVDGLDAREARFLVHLFCAVLWCGMGCVGAVGVGRAGVRGRKE